MRRLFIMLLLLRTNAHVLRVVDGDTILIDAPWVPKPLSKTIYLRVSGIDTPELFSPKCDKEYILAKAAKQFTENFVLNPVSITFEKWDKYGGRIIGSVSYNEHNLSDALLKLGFARKYQGAAKGDWC